MNIDLYYVEGISRIDTPSFNTKNHIGTIEDQEDFFLTKKVKTVEIAFYPPHYRDQIKFDKADLVITDNVNYLSFEFGDKTYYYFIEKINYTSTGVILLDISMDVIQTYMFDTYISSGIIERKFINRWNGSNINRNYVRENVSDGLFVQKYYYNVPMPVREMMIVAKSNYVSQEYASIIEYHNDTMSRNIIYPSLIYMIPYGQGTIKSFQSLNSQSTLHYDMGITFNNLAKDPQISEVYLIPFNSLKNVDYTNSYIDFTYNQTDPDFFGINDSVFGNDYIKYLRPAPYALDPDANHYSSADYPVKLNHISHTFDFIKNTDRQDIFRSEYMPVMLDENYIKFEFGTRSSLTSYPLYETNKIVLQCCYYASYLTGSRHYYITDRDSDYYDNKRTIVSDYEPIKLDLLSDEYAQFNATNKYRWLEAIGSSLINGAKFGISAGLRASYAANDIIKIASTALTPKRQKLSKRGQRAIESIQTQQRDKTPGEIEEGISSISPITSALIREGNMYFTPDTNKQSGMLSDLVANAIQILWIKSFVQDYEQCAQYYHRNGYLVNEYVTQVSNIFNSVKNRYYFDMLKMSIPEVHLHNVIEDEDTIGLIEERLEQGLRLWNVLNTDVIIGDFTYDNVENDYLS